MDELRQLTPYFSLFSFFFIFPLKLGHVTVNQENYVKGISKSAQLQGGAVSKSPFAWQVTDETPMQAQNEE